MRRFKPGHAIDDPTEVFYVERETDRLLLERLRARQPSVLIAPRQVGKTSLLKQTSRQLESEGFRVVFLDLQLLGVSSGTSPQLGEERWYRSLANAIARTLGLGSRTRAFFEGRSGETPVAIWTAFIRDVVLAEIREPIVAFIDEMDRTLNLPFARDDFFGALRAMDNQRAIDDAWKRWTVCLSGVAAPFDLVKDPKQPLFVPPDGVLRLADLSRAELTGFAEGLAALDGDPQEWLDAVYSWTSGHPAMSQKLCAALLLQPKNGVGGPSEQARVTAVVHSLFLGEGRSQDALLLDVEHRFPIRWTSQAEEERAAAVLSTYQRARMAAPPAFDANDPSHIALILSGLAAERLGRLAVRNRIYREAFDEHWVAARLEVRLIAKPLAAWIESGRSDETLPQGVDLARLQGWAAGRALAEGEREFLAASERQVAEQARIRAEAERDRAQQTARIRLQVTMGVIVAAVALLGMSIALYVEKQKADRFAADSEDNAARTMSQAATHASLSPQGMRDAVANAIGAARAWYKRPYESEAELFKALLAAEQAAKQTGVLYGHHGAVNNAVFSPDGTRVVTASSDTTARIWDAANGKSLAELRHTGAVNNAVFSPDGTRVVTACAGALKGVTPASAAAASDAIARIWDAANGTPLTDLRGHTDAVNNAVFSPDGKRVVTASDDNTARVWDAANGTPLTELRGHTGAVNNAVFSPDGKRVVTASSDKTARIWDAANGTLLAELTGHTDAVSNAEFSPDGTRVITGSSDRSARIWPSNVHSALSDICAAVDSHRVWWGRLADDVKTDCSQGRSASNASPGR
jgi:AAA-like domain/WD domain, G-beta repeat